MVVQGPPIQAERSKADSSRSKSIQTDRSRAKPSEADRSRAKPSEADRSKSIQTDRSRAKPSEAERSRAKPSEAERSRAKPSEAERPEPFRDWTRMVDFNLREISDEEGRDIDSSLTIRANPPRHSRRDLPYPPRRPTTTSTNCLVRATCRRGTHALGLALSRVAVRGGAPARRGVLALAAAWPPRRDGKGP